MPIYQIEMLWECPQCHYQDNRGLARHCIHCGKAKTDAAIERMPDDTSIANALTGEAKRKAQAGPDWKCKFCATLQNSLEPYCRECGALGPTVSVRRGYAADSKRTFSNKSEAKKNVVQKIEVSPNPHENVPYREFVPNTGDYRNPPTAIEPPLEKEDLTKNYGVQPDNCNKLSATSKKAFLGTGITAAVIFVLWLLFRTKEYDVTVRNVSWHHSVEVQRFHSVPHDGFDPPSDAENIRDLGMRFHHMNHMKVGSHPETQSYTYSCRTHCTTTRGACTTTPERCTTTPRTCTSNKNGTATCSGGDRSCTPSSRSCAPDTEYCPPCTGTRVVMIDDYQDFPITQTWYSWSEWEWTHARTVVADGTTNETRWPSDKELEPGYTLRPREQERFLKQASYQVQFSDSKESWKFNPKTLDEFSKYRVGSHYRIRANAAGSIAVLSGQGMTESY